jgi:hypothetical protein
MRSEVIDGSEFDTFIHQTVFLLSFLPQFQIDIAEGEELTYDYYIYETDWDSFDL